MIVKIHQGKGEGKYMNPKVSIIVPIYNAQKTIARCIDSILNQDYTDFELLLIDDGSKDDSCYWRTSLT